MLSILLDIRFNAHSKHSAFTISLLIVSFCLSVVGRAAGLIATPEAGVLEPGGGDILGDDNDSVGVGTDSLAGDWVGVNMYLAGVASEGGGDGDISSSSNSSPTGLTGVVADFRRL